MRPTNLGSAPATTNPRAKRTATPAQLQYLFSDLIADFVAQSRSGRIPADYRDHNGNMAISATIGTHTLRLTISTKGGTL